MESSGNAMNYEHSFRIKSPPFANGRQRTRQQRRQRRGGQFGRDRARAPSAGGAVENIFVDNARCVKASRAGWPICFARLGIPVTVIDARTAFLDALRD
jgi:hypothetical protein